MVLQQVVDALQQALQGQARTEQRLGGWGHEGCQVAVGEVLHIPGGQLSISITIIIIIRVAVGSQLCLQAQDLGAGQTHGEMRVTSFPVEGSQ